MTNDDIDKLWHQAMRDAIKNGEDFTRHRFAHLVAAAERDKYEVQFKKLMQLHEVRESQPNKLCCLAEREACARACEAKRIVKGGEVFAAAIRARGNT